MEFIRGKYDLNNVDYIKQLFSDMTYNERLLIRTKTFQELWNHVWYQQFVIHRHTNEYNFAKSKFDSLQAGFYLKDVFIDINQIIMNTRSVYLEPEWGFPKGRRRIKEDDVTCAIREFVEETGCPRNEIIIQNDFSTFEEVFFGTNHVLYRHIYYVGKMQYDGKKVLDVNKNDINQVREVRAIEWFTYDEILENIRVHNKERKYVFQQVHKLITSTHVSDS
jgi:8-oxo-dGTP pyrophosphatase MutT (NUDIX family)